MIRNRPGPLVDYVPSGSGDIADAAGKCSQDTDLAQQLDLARNNPDPAASVLKQSGVKSEKADETADQVKEASKTDQINEKQARENKNPEEKQTGPTARTPLSGPEHDPGPLSVCTNPASADPAAEMGHAAAGDVLVQDNRSTIVSPEGALSFLFAIFALLMGFMAILENINQATLLSVGVTWLILSFGALIASLINMIRGSDKGNTNLLATVLLGIFPGINTLITLDALVNGVPYKPVIVGLLYVVGAVLCFGAACTRRSEPFYIFLRTFAVACGLFLVGFGDMISSHLILAVGGYFLFLYSLLSIYYGLSVLYPSYGYSLPQGRPLQEILDDKAGFWNQKPARNKKEGRTGKKDEAQNDRLRSGWQTKKGSEDR